MFYIILTTTNYLYCTRTELTAVKYNSHAQQQKQTGDSYRSRMT